MESINNQAAYGSKVYLDHPDEIKGYLSKNPKGYLQRWELKGSEDQTTQGGIQISSENKFEWLLSHSRIDGIYLRPVAFLTTALEEKFYNHESWLFRGIIFTHAQLKENPNYLSDSKVKIGVRKLPKRTITLISEDKSKIIGLAKKAGLPLEEEVLNS
ncbi:hypothetical protein HOD29_02360 [archaeon]|jgi:hypothetical protein|nr:hypothetical protein [archaeon]